MNKTMFILAAGMVFSVSHLPVAANPDCPNLEEVIIASKNHLDVGFACTVPELMRRLISYDVNGTAIRELVPANSLHSNNERK